MLAKLHFFCHAGSGSYSYRFVMLTQSWHACERTGWHVAVCQADTSVVGPYC